MPQEFCAYFLPSGLFPSDFPTPGSSHLISSITSSEKHILSALCNVSTTVFLSHYTIFLINLTTNRKVLFTYYSFWLSLSIKKKNGLNLTHEPRYPQFLL